MISRVRTYLLAAAAVVLAAGCAPEKPSEKMLQGTVERSDKARPVSEIEKEAVVVVDGEEISLAEFNRRLRELPEFARARFSTVEKKQQYLDTVAQFEMMADVAEERGLGTRAAVLDAMKTALAERVASEVVREKLSMNDIDEAAIERYYSEHPDEFRTPAARRVALIEADTREDAETVRERVIAAIEKADDPVIEFRRAAAGYSVDREVAKEGGDVGFVEAPRADSERPTLAREVFDLEKKGQVSPVFTFDDGFALATFFEERPEKVVSLEEATGEIRQKLYEKRKAELAREFLAQLREDIDVERHQDVAARAEAPPPKGVRRVEDVPLQSSDK